MQNFRLPLQSITVALVGLATLSVVVAGLFVIMKCGLYFMAGVGIALLLFTVVDFLVSMRRWKNPSSAFIPVVILAILLLVIGALLVGVLLGSWPDLPSVWYLVVLLITWTLFRLTLQIDRPLGIKLGKNLVGSCLVWTAAQLVAFAFLLSMAYSWESYIAVGNHEYRVTYEQIEPGTLPNIRWNDRMPIRGWQALPPTTRASDMNDGSYLLLRWGARDLWGIDLLDNSLRVEVTIRQDRDGPRMLGRNNAEAIQVLSKNVDPDDHSLAFTVTGMRVANSWKHTAVARLVPVKPEEGQWRLMVDFYKQHPWFGTFQSVNHVIRIGPGTDEQPMVTEIWQDKP